MVNSLSYHLSKRNEKKIDRLKYKVIVFVLPEKSNVGAQKNEISFPFEGEIHEILASCRVTGEADTVFSIEKISSTLYEDSEAHWTKVADSVIISTGKKKSEDTLVNIIEKRIEEDDFIRVVIESTGSVMRNITVEVVVKLDII